MGKRGQITTFVVIGLVLIAVIGVFIYTRQMQVQQATTTAGREVVSADVRPLQIFVEQCIQKTAVPGIYLLGEQGGYINPPANSYDSDIFTIGYGFSGNSTTLPTIEAMQAEISDYLKEFIPLCTAGFEDFKKEGTEISEGNITVNATIFQDKVQFAVNYPIEVRSLGKSSSLKSFYSTVPIKLGYYHDVASQIIDNSRGGITITDLFFPSLNVNLLPVSGDTLIFALVDNSTVIDNRTYMFLFAYELSTNSAPVMEDMESLAFVSGSSVYAKAVATDPDGDNITFSTDSPEFPINPDTGEISTTAPAPGEYRVTVTADDGKGGKAEQVVVFNVVAGLTPVNIEEPS